MEANRDMHEQWSEVPSISKTLSFVGHFGKGLLPPWCAGVGHAGLSYCGRLIMNRRHPGGARSSDVGVKPTDGERELRWWGFEVGAVVVESWPKGVAAVRWEPKDGGDGGEAKRRR
ncbi:hypothetical protein RHSIM_Rhsim13G0132500 [Rhododendron simsii]|uniref:Uncharacterized protein n=1 Tax=Rhododendron simsii TaxID=118357 RepID=A0A834FY50_RHOSS|nr:hypothetical protein RHSIM_Rhsim13G0132500 [Rhododendron simsii]